MCLGCHQTRMFDVIKWCHSRYFFSLTNTAPFDPSWTGVSQGLCFCGVSEHWRRQALEWTWIRFKSLLSSTFSYVTSASKVGQRATTYLPQVAKPGGQLLASGVRLEGYSTKCIGTWKGGRTWKNLAREICQNEKITPMILKFYFEEHLGTAQADMCWCRSWSTIFIQSKQVIGDITFWIIQVWVNAQKCN